MYRMTGQGVLQAFAAAEREEGMLRYLPVLALSLTVLPTVVSAQQGRLGTPQQQRACRPDVVRYCRGMDDDHVIANCLRANIRKLRPACREVIEGGGR